MLLSAVGAWKTVPTMKNNDSRGHLFGTFVVWRRYRAVAGGGSEPPSLKVQVRKRWDGRWSLLPPDPDDPQA
jgi:hypothetical protein